MSSNAAPETGEEIASGAMPTDQGLDSPPSEPHIDREVPKSPENKSNKSPAASAASTRSDTETQSSSGSEAESDMEDDYDEFSFLFNAAPRPPPRYEVNRRLAKAKAKRPMRYVQTAISQHIDDHGTLLKNLSNRIGILEYEIENLQKNPYLIPGPPPPPPLPLPPYPIIEYGHHNWFYRSYYVPGRQPKYTLEVNLLSDVNGICSFLASHQETCSDVDGEKSACVDESGPLASFEGVNLLPYKVRITSSHLCQCLRELGKEMSFYNNSIVFLSPFKMFVGYEKEIRAMFKDKEAKIESERERRLLENQQKTSGADGDVEERYEVSEDKDSRPISPVASVDSEAELNSEREEMKFQDLQFECEHLRLLVQFFDGSLKPILNLYHSIKARSITQIPFDYLWYLFDHGQEVVRQGGHLQVSRVLRFTGGRDTVTSVQSTGLPNTIPPLPPGRLPRGSITKSSFHVDCYFWGFDGEGFRPVVETIDIKPYAGFRDIASLPIYPLAFHEKSDTIRSQLLERGDKFLSLSKKNEVVHRHYTGLTLESDCTNAEEIDSRIIIDQRSAILEKPNWKPPEYTSTRTAYDTRELCVDPRGTDDVIHLDQVQDHADSESWFSERKDALESPEDLDAPPAEDKILLPYYLYGFILRSRKWAKFSIELINSIEDKNSFDDLVLQEGHADAIKALVENHNRGPGRDKENGHVEISMDLVKGKGKGVIILLHGEPGVGKTSTAECIADYTSRPLYPITCGDIGETADTVEENLEKTFQLAHKWGCVLLLDEADVFLQERNREDLRRNAVVSVFLRVLEYYSGILFLTTNRVGIIDQAFRSRIHLSLFYPALDKSATLTIWRMHLDTAKRRFKERGQVLEVDKKQVLKFAREQFKKMKANNMNTWNGRQIRNAFQTAIALAEYRAQGKGDIHHQKKKGKKITKLTVDQFKIVQQTSDSFDEYLLATQKATQSSQARANKTRSDDFKAKEQYAESSKAKSASAKPKGRLEKKKVKVEPESDSTITSDSSEEEEEEEESSEDDDSQSDSDAVSEQEKSDDSDEDVEEIVSKKGKGKKSISGKKGEDVAAKSEKIKTKKKESKKRVEDSDEEHETEAKVEKKRGKK